MLAPIATVAFIRSQLGQGRRISPCLARAILRGASATGTPLQPSYQPVAHETGDNEDRGQDGDHIQQCHFDSPSQMKARPAPAPSCLDIELQVSPLSIDGAGQPFGCRADDAIAALRRGYSPGEPTSIRFWVGGAQLRSLGAACAPPPPPNPSLLPAPQADRRHGAERGLGA
jgi:hypothetical protein